MSTHFAPTRAGRIGALAACLALPAAMLAGCAAHVEREPRPVIFVSFDQERTRAAFARFEADAESLHVTQRYGVKLEFVGVDLTDPPALSSAIARALQRHPAALVAPSGAALVEAMRQTKTTPIIFATHQDPVDLQVVPSLVQRRSNIAGISFSLPVETKMLEVLLQAAPGARRIGFMVDEDMAGEASIAEFLARSARQFGIQWTMVRLGAVDRLQRDLRDAGAVDAWFVTKAAVVDEHAREFVAAIAATRRPAIYPSRAQVDLGAPLSYEAVFDDPLGALARQLDRVLSGVAPDSIPIERPKRFVLAVNPAAARALGMRVPAELLARADVVL
ncbi:MAG TPA: ABC transporter substrate binding protein [Usitatibacter sp.]|nr:ABC transporter substrate binding protein [Usitatibacter sp.]